MTREPTTRTVAPGARWALAALSLAMLLASLGTSVANVALPTLEERFGGSFGQVQWVVLAYLVSVTALVVTAGRLGDLAGRRRLLMVGLAVFALASGLCAAAPTLGLLVAARALQGVGAALMMALALAVVPATVPAARTGTAMGVLGTTSAIGTALGPSLGGILIAGVGWRAIFLVNVPLSLAALALAHRHLPVDRAAAPSSRPRFDVAGTVLLAVALGAYALAMTVGHGDVDAAGAALLGVAAVGVVTFAAVETRAAEPLVRLGMLREPALRAGLVTSAVVSTVMMATLVVGPFYLARGLGLGPAAVGLVMSVGPAVVVLSGVPAGRLADRLGARPLVTIGLAGMLVGALLLAVAPPGLGVAGYLAPIVVVTLGYALFQTANNTAVMAGAAPDRRGVTSGLLNLARNLGLVTGASVMGAVFTRAAGTAHPATAGSDEIASGLHAAFAVAAVLIGVAIALAARRPRRVASARTAEAPEA